jgi:hypothetical protein
MNVRVLSAVYSPCFNFAQRPHICRIMVDITYPMQAYSHSATHSFLQVCSSRCDQRPKRSQDRLQAPRSSLRAPVVPTQELDTSGSLGISKYGQRIHIPPVNARARQKSSLDGGSKLRHFGPSSQVKHTPQAATSSTSRVSQRPPKAPAHASVPLMQKPLVCPQPSPGAKPLFGRPYPQFSTIPSTSSYLAHGPQLEDVSARLHSAAVLNMGRAQRTISARQMEAQPIRQTKVTPATIGRHSPKLAITTDEPLVLANPFLSDPPRETQYPKVEVASEDDSLVFTNPFLSDPRLDRRPQRPLQWESNRPAVPSDGPQLQRAREAPPSQGVEVPKPPSKRRFEMDRGEAQERTPKRLKTNEPIHVQHSKGQETPVDKIHQYSPKKRSPLSKSPIEGQPTSLMVKAVTPPVRPVRDDPKPDFRYARIHGTPFPGTNVSSEQASRPRLGAEADGPFVKTNYEWLNENREEGVGLASLVVQGDSRETRWRYILMNEAYDPVESSATLRCPTFEDNSWWKTSRYF